MIDRRIHSQLNEEGRLRHVLITGHSPARSNAADPAI
jgi:hypothetical protein